MGTYTPTPGTSTTKWLCIDLDVGDHHADALSPAEGLALAEQLIDELAPFGYLEVSGSGKGYHVWVFFEGPAPAANARALAYRLLGPKYSLSKAIQVYPRQDFLPEDKIGNMVWLPWWGQKCPVQDADGDPVTPEDLDDIFEFPVEELPQENATRRAKGVERPGTEPSENTRRMLTFLDGKEMDYALRIKILQALHAEYGADGIGRDLAEEWVATWKEDSTSRAKFDTHWNSFSDGGGVKFGSLVYHAVQAGYTDEPTTPTVRPSEGERTIANGTDLCLAEYLIDELEEHGPLVWAFQKVWQFDGTVYAALDDPDIDNSIYNLHDRWPESAAESAKPKPLNISASKQRNIRHVLNVRVSKRSFEGMDTGVVFENGLLGPDGLVPHTSESFVTHKVPCKFDEDAVNPQWQDFLDRTFDGDEDAPGCQRFIQQFTGACLMGEASHYGRAVLMYGDGGTGKSTLIETVEGMFPEDCLIHIHPQALKDQYARAELASSKLNTMKDLPHIGFSQTGYFKDAVEGARINARRPYGQIMYLKPKCGFLFAANALPYTEDTTGGFWRRWALLACRNVIPEARQNRDFREQLVQGAKTESWMYAWAWRGYQQLLERGVYDLPKSHYTLQDEWRQMSDPCFQWFHHAATKDDTESVEVGEAYGRYKSWCFRQGHKHQAKTLFMHSMMSFGVKKQGRNRLALSLR